MATSTTPPDTMLSRKFFSDGVGDVWHDQRRGHARRGQPGRHLLLHGRPDGHRPRPRLQGLERRRGGAPESGDDGQRRRDGGHGEDQGELTNSIRRRRAHQLAGVWRVAMDNWTCGSRRPGRLRQFEWTGRRSAACARSVWDAVWSRHSGIRFIFRGESLAMVCWCLVSCTVVGFKCLVLRSENLNPKEG
jgi:hypothetical protein